MIAAIILVNFQNNTDSPGDYIGTLQNEVIPQTNSFYQEISYGAASFRASVFGWVTLPIPATCDIHAINVAFRSMAPAPVDLSPFNRVVYVLPASACGGFGVTSVDGVFMSPPSTGTLAHELGHTLGLGHSNAWDCGSVIFDPLGGCVWIEYGNPYDVMGSVNLFHFNADFKDYLGWLAPQIVTASGTYELDPLELADSKVKSIKIPYTLNGQTLHYWLEYRQPLGFDAVDETGATPNFDGIMINVDPPGFVGGYVSFLLDVDPATPPNPSLQRQISPLLRLNETFVDPATGVRVTPVSLTSASAMVKIQVPSPSLVRPTVTLTGPLPGTRVSPESPLLLTAQANSVGDSISRVDFMDVDQTLFQIGESVSPPYSFIWRSFPGGLVSILARAVSAGGLIGHSPVAPIYVNLPPVVRLTSPAHDSNVPIGTSVTVTASASDPDGSIAKVEFFDGETSLGARSSPPFSLVVSTFSAGLHPITAVATDNQGAQSRSAPVKLTAYSPGEIVSAAVSQMLSTGIASLSVLGGPPDTESGLRYQWQTAPPSPGTVSFSPNGTNAAKMATATFSAPGTYTLQVTVTNPSGESAINTVSVAVLPPDHTYTIKVRHSGECIDLQQRTPAPSPIIQNACDASQAQSFLIEPTIDGSFRIVSAFTHFCFDMPYGSIDDDVGVQQYSCNPGDGQRFFFVSLGDGSFELQNVPSGLCLTVPSPGLGPGLALIQLPCTGTSDQAFLFSLMDAGTLSVVTANLPDAVPGIPYQVQLLASGGKAPYTWSVLANSLPFGMSLSPSGALTGSPLLVNSWANTVNVTFSVADAAASQAIVEYGLRLDRPDPFAPAINSGGIVSAAAPAVVLPAIPAGGFISVFGANFSPAPAIASPPFPPQLNGVSVYLANRPLPLAYVGANQINAIVPYDVPLNTLQRLYVSSGGRTSLGQMVAVTGSQPTVFTKNQRGTGQGAITNAQTGELAQPGSPVREGDNIAIYCAGLGAVTPPVMAGMAAPSDILAHTILPIQVNVGGLNAAVTFAGLAPTFAGLYQVNAVVPQGVSTGDAVVVTLTVQGVVSPPVTIAIR